jgi:hypothetical protein
MVQSDGGFIHGWAGRIRGIITKAETAVFAKSAPYDYRPELEKMISDLAGQATGWCTAQRKC